MTTDIISTGSQKPVKNLIALQDLSTIKDSITIGTMKPKEGGYKSKINGYNLFTHAVINSDHLKELYKNAIDRMSISGQLWRSMTAEEKKVWAEKARELSSQVTEKVTPKVVKSSVRTESEYDRFRRVHFHDESIKKLVSFGDKAKEVAKMWKEYKLQKNQK